MVVSPLGPPLVYGARCGSRGSGSIPEGEGLQRCMLSKAISTFTVEMA